MTPFCFVAAVVALVFFEATRIVFWTESESARTKALLATNIAKRRPPVFAGFWLPSFPSQTEYGGHGGGGGGDDAVTREFEDFMGEDAKGELEVTTPAFSTEPAPSQGEDTAPASSTALAPTPANERKRNKNKTASVRTEPAPAPSQGEDTAPASSTAPAPAAPANTRKSNKKKTAPVRIIHPDTSSVSPYAVDADDPRFQKLYSEFTKALHAQPEQLAFRPWYLPGTKNKKDKQPCIDYFPGLSDSLVQDAFRGKRITLVGDSTSLYMTQNLQILVLHYPSAMIDQFMDLTLTEGKIALAKAGYKKHKGYRRRFLRSSNSSNDDNFNDCGDEKDEEEEYDFGIGDDSSSEWRQTSRRLSPKTKRLHLNIQTDGTSIEWEGRSGVTKETVCRWKDVLEHIDEEKPNVMTINFGLHWLHMFNYGRDGVPCSVPLWNNYEDWLDQMVKAAAKAGAKLVLFKTTNHICERKYHGAYAKGLKLYGDKSNNQVIQSCVNGITGRLKAKSALALVLTDEIKDRYCREAQINNYGVNKLNERLFNFMQLQKEKVKKGGLPSDMIFEMFRDNELQRCQYSSDGRHYSGQDLARVRLLGNLIQCLYKK